MKGVARALLRCTRSRRARRQFSLPAAAQQMYRWTDENGRTHITDTPPPPGAKNVRKVKPAANATAKDKPAKPMPSCRSCWRER